jgi:hypothetical protein
MLRMGTRRFFRRKSDFRLTSPYFALCAPQLPHDLAKRWLAAKLALWISGSRLPELRNGIMPRADTPVIKAVIIGGGYADGKLYREVCSRQNRYEGKRSKDLLSADGFELADSTQFLVHGVKSSAHEIIGP